MVLLMNNPGQLGLSGTDMTRWSLGTIGPATGTLHMLFSLFPTHWAHLSRCITIISSGKRFLIHPFKSQPFVIRSPRNCFFHSLHQVKFLRLCSVANVSNGWLFLSHWTVSSIESRDISFLHRLPPMSDTE